MFDDIILFMYFNEVKTLVILAVITSFKNNIVLKFVVALTNPMDKFYVCHT